MHMVWKINRLVALAVPHAMYLHSCVVIELVEYVVSDWVVESKCIMIKMLLMINSVKWRPYNVKINSIGGIIFFEVLVIEMQEQI